jgi:hypothetical protein
MSTTDSLPQQSLEQPESKPASALRQALEAAAGVTRLGRMAAVKSVARNLKREDDAVARNVDTHERGLWGGELAPAPSSDGENMENMAGRDVHIHYHSPVNETPVSAPATAQSAAPKPASSTLRKLVTTAGLVGLGVAAPFAAPAVMNWFSPPAATAPSFEDTNLDVQLEIGPE